MAAEIQETNNFQIGASSSKLPNAIVGYFVGGVISLLCAFTYNMSSSVEKLVTKVEVLETNLNNISRNNNESKDGINERIDKLEMRSALMQDNLNRLLSNEKIK